MMSKKKCPAGQFCKCYGTLHKRDVLLEQAYRKAAAAEKENVQLKADLAAKTAELAALNAQVIAVDSRVSDMDSRVKKLEPKV